MPYFKYIVHFFFILTSLNAYGEKVVMVFGQSLAPYIIEENNSGVELLIIKEALALEGHELVPVYTQLGRVKFIFNQGKVDAAHRYITATKKEKDIFYGDTTIEYHDVFFTLEEKDITIRSPSDLNEYTLLSFQDAKKHYPRWLPESYKHSQTSVQLNQVRLLQLGLVDIVLSDKNIFDYHTNLYRQSSREALKNMRMHVFTSPYKYHPVFKSRKIAVAFNRGLKELKEMGRHSELISKKLRANIFIANQIDLTL